MAGRAAEEHMTYTKRVLGEIAAAEARLESRSAGSTAAASARARGIVRESRRTLDASGWRGRTGSATLRRG